jgi:hypothetical protein
MINFPDAPTANQQFTSGNTVWTWDTAKWVAASAPLATPLAITQGGTGAATAPAALTNLGAVHLSGDTMTGKLIVNFNTATPPVNPTAQLHVAAADNSHASILVDTFGTAVTPFLTTRRARGTAAAPTAVQLGDILGQWAINARGATAYQYGGAVGCFALENWSDAACGSQFIITTIDAGTTTARNAVIVQRGVQIGAPTGGDLGPGTINAAGDITAAGNFYGGNGLLKLTTAFVADSYIWPAGTGILRIINAANTVTNLIIDNSGNLTITGGTATKAGGGSWVAPSDMQLKVRDSIVAYTTGLDAITQLQPVTYQYNGTAGLPTDQTFHGLVADDVELVMPEAVGRAVLGARPALSDDEVDEPGQEYRTFDSTPVLFALVNAVKELKAQLDAVRAAMPVGTP